VNIFHTLHNMSIAVAILLIYTSFVAYIWIMGRNVSYRSETTNSAQRVAFTQAAFISAVHVIGCTLYVYMQYFPSQIAEWMIHVASVLWVVSQGSPPFIYLSMNRAIREGVVQLIFSTTRLQSLAANSGPQSTAVVPTGGPTSPMTVTPPPSVRFQIASCARMNMCYRWLYVWRLASEGCHEVELYTIRSL